MQSGGDLRKQHATGDYSVGRHIWDKAKWAVYSPTGVCLGRYDVKAEAKRDAERLRRENHG